MPSGAEDVPVETVEVAAYTVPTEQPESDGTLEWAATTLVVVHVAAGGETGIGYAYTHAAAARVIHDDLAPLVTGMDAMRVERCWDAMRARVRNVGTDQLAGWVRGGIPRVKMKVGRHPDEDPERVRQARDAIGPRAELFVDANGAYRRKQALAMAERFADSQVSWFEEPVSSDDRDGLRLIRDRAPEGMAVTAGEYGWSVYQFRDLIAAGAIDVAQPDATRCGGYTGFLRVAGLCDAHGVPVSAHTAPQLHAHVCVAAPGVEHLECFHDHDRIERMLFDGALIPEGGTLRPDRSRPGNGLTLRREAAAEFRVH